jgi:hypothetical protein
MQLLEAAPNDRARRDRRHRAPGTALPAYRAAGQRAKKGAGSTGRPRT